MKRFKENLSEYKIFIMIALFVLLLIGASFYFQTNSLYTTQYNFALLQAKENFQKDIVYRNWAALEGGVYVPKSDYTPSNPYLDVPNRDVETKEGLNLALVNPAYMTRMVHGLQLKEEGTISHITSLKPINPNNKPDAWEEQALKEIEKGILNEKHELTKLNGKDYFRYISPLKVEKACLKCHAKQGYKIGDIRGGISVSIPYNKFEGTIKSYGKSIVFTHGSAALLSLIFLFLAAKTYTDKNKKILDELKQINFVIDSANIGYWEYDLIKKELKVNENWLKALGYDPQQFDKSYKYNLTTVHEDDREKTIQVLDDIQNNRLKEFTIEHRVKKENGEFLWVSTRGYVQEFKHNKPLKIVGVQTDIDKDKKIVESIIKQQVVFKSFIENSPLALSITNLSDGKYILVNKAWEKLSGYSQSEAIGKTTLELKLWLDIKERQKFVDELRSKGSVNDLKLKFRIKNGKIIPTLNSASIIDIEGSKYIITSIKDITEQKKFEKVLIKEKEMYSYFNFLHSSIDKMNEQDFYNLSIEYLVKLTESKVGFFHRVSEDQNEIILTTWNSAAKEFCKVEYQTHYPINQAGNWIDCLKTKKALIYNYYKNSPNQKGLPVGHVPVEKFMSIATYLNEKPYLIFGVGNKEEDYDEIDAQLLENFADELSRLIEKQQYITKIEENERFVSTLIVNLPGFIYRCANDKDWTMYYLSKQCKETTGYEPEELLNNSLLSYNDIILPEFQKEIWEKIQDSIKNDLPYELEYQIVKKDGNIIWVWERGRAVKDTDGNILYLEGYITDITDRKQAEEEIKKLLTAIEQSEVSIVITDKQANIEYVNPHFTKVTGYSKEESLNQNPRILKSGNTTLEEYKKMWEQLTAGQTWEGIFLNKKKNGELFWESSIITPIKNEKNEITNYIAVKEDITEDIEKERKLKEYSEHLEELVKERTVELDKLNNELMEQLKRDRKLEEELKISLNKEKELNELRRNFIASVSHEFRTPLAALSSSVQLILRYHKKWSEEKLQEYFTKVEDITDQLTKLIEQVLTISRAEREILKYNPVKVKIKEQFEGIIYKVRPKLKSKQTIKYNNNCQREEYLLDPSLIEHVVSNLIINAIKFSPEESKIEVMTEEIGKEIKITVKDEGMGIPKEEIKFIFEPFYRTSNSQNIPGTGLGLNIVKRCIELMDGKIEVESEINKGTTFIITIPIKDESDEKNIDN